MTKLTPSAAVKILRSGLQDALTSLCGKPPGYCGRHDCPWHEVGATALAATADLAPEPCASCDANRRMALEILTTTDEPTP